jgi:signal peptidase I
VTDTITPIEEGDQGLRAPPVVVPAPTSRSRRGAGTDYRLRGLDLGAQKSNQSPAPTRGDLPRRRHRRRVLIGWIVVLAVGTAVAFFLRTGVEPYVVRSTAMAPALRPGDRVEVVKSSLFAGPIGRGEIVLVRDPAIGRCGTVAGGAQDLPLRVIGLPGQTLWSVGDTIYVNGKRLNEPGWYNAKFGQVGSTAIPRTTVAPDEYFLMGDNRSQSCDSRSFGVVSRSAIVGKVISLVLRGGHPYIHFL